MDIKPLLDKLRAAPWLVLAALLLIWIAWRHTDYIGLLAWGVCRVALGAWLGYWIDRTLFPYSRPHDLDGIARGAAEKRRAMIVAACLIALAWVP